MSCPRVLAQALGLVLGLALVPGVLPAPVSAAPAPDPAALPLGDRPAVAWQSGTTVHLANGRTVRLPRLGLPSQLEVLGRRGGEYIVVVDGNAPTLVAVRGGRVRTVWKHVYDESATSYRLASKGALVAEENHTRSGSSYVEVLDLAGKRVASRSDDDYQGVLDFVGSTLLLGGAGDTVSWSVPGRPEGIAPSAWFGDLDADVLFVDQGDDLVGPTALSAPGAPPWTATFRPVALSPDGAWIAGWDRAYTPRLEVRSLATGALAPASGLKVVRDGAMTWEPGGSLLVEVRTGKGRALVRCTVSGVCERATPWSKGRFLSFLS